MTAGPIAWCRKNLFATAGDAALSIVFIPLSLWAAGGIIVWAIHSARWDVVTDNVRLLLIGTYPPRELWRTWLAAAMLCALAGATVGFVFPVRGGRLRLAAISAPAAACGAFALGGAVTPGWAFGCAAAAGLGWVTGSCAPLSARILIPGWLAGLSAICAILAPAGTARWGGLLLSVLVTLLAAILSFPLGMLLAIGRRSRVPSLRICCTAYIEFIRSVPLIAVIYWAWIIVPLTLSATDYVPDLVRGVGGFVIFFAAYVAEFVRGGLQGVPAGQVEAACSLGLGPVNVFWHVVFPQAIRAVIPALVGNVLDIFNNVPLVFIIGLTDFLKAGQTILADPQYGGCEYEVYGFMFAVYLGIGSVISFAARRLEVKMGLSTR